MTQEDTVPVLDVTNCTYGDLIRKFVDDKTCIKAKVEHPLVTKNAVLTGLFRARLSLGLKRTVKIATKGQRCVSR